MVMVHVTKAHQGRLEFTPKRRPSGAVDTQHSAGPVLQTQALTCFGLVARCHVVSAAHIYQP